MKSDEQLWHYIVGWNTTLTSDQKLDEDKFFSSKERFSWDTSKCTPVYIKMYPWQEVEWGIWLMYPCVLLWSEVLGCYI